MCVKNKLTIIIPTRDRCETLFHTIRTCLNQTYKNYQVIVSDNFSKDDTKRVVDSFNDDRLLYINPRRRLSMSENFDFALSHVDDGFIMYIGDDDAILPNSLEHVNYIINSSECEAIMSYNAFYTWPDTLNPNKLYWGPRTGFEIRKSKIWIKKYLRFNMEYTFDLPSVYCGFVKKSVLSSLIREKSFFKSSTPDAYSAIAVAFAIDNYAFSYTPFVIHGSSSKSNGGSYLGRAKGQEGKEVKLFFNENTIPFHNKVVMTKSFRICSIEAFLQFSDNFPEYTFNYKIDWENLLMHVLKERNDNTKDEIEDAVKQMCVMHNVNYDFIINNVPNKFSGVPVKEMISRIFFKLKNTIDNKTIKINNTTRFGVSNVYDASLLLHFFLNTKRNNKLISKK